MMSWVILGLTLLMALAPLQADSKSFEQPSTPDIHKMTMNDYSLTEFGDFTKWQLLTVRYRRDTGEMRFTYANALAMKTLLANSTDYPDGAVFAKVGVATLDDPDFVSSAVPSGAKRFQLMVMDHQKNSQTHGWGYALFGADGAVLNDDPAGTTKSCNACHELVPQRGYVFSKPLNLRIGVPAASEVPATTRPSPLSFQPTPLALLPSIVRLLLPPGTPSVELLHGQLEVQPFSGTLDEIRPNLSAQAVSARSPAALISHDGQQYVLAVPSLDEQCDAGGGQKGIPMKVFFTPPHTGPIATPSFCQALSTK